MESIVFYLIMAAISYGIAYAMRPKPKEMRPAGESEFDMPTAKEGRIVPVVYGTRRCTAPNVLWYGDAWGYRKRRSGSTVCFYYAFGIHFGICHGNTDGVKQIWVSDKVVWPTLDSPLVQAADAQTSGLIDATYCFGGWERGGGVWGNVDFQYGESDQVLNSYLQSKLGSNIPAFRGLTCAIAKQVYIGTSVNPYPWSFLVKRTDKLTDGSAQWYSAKADIGGNLNAAHIIREAMTSTIVGLGISTDEIDSTSFEAAADTLYTEGFGLSYVQDHVTADGIKAFLDEILQTIAGVLYQDMSTGKFHLELTREDYNPATLTVYDEDDIITIEDYTRPGYGQVPSQVIVWWHDAIFDQERPAPDEDIAILEKQGGNHVVREFRYTGICDYQLANQVAAREMRQAGAMPATMRLVGTRKLASLHPNSVFKLSFPALGISEMIVRVVGLDKGDLLSPEVVLDCVEDVFGIAYTVFGDPQESEWSVPETTEDEQLTEIGEFSAVGSVTSIESGPY